jgi:hypothetical protein
LEEFTLTSSPNVKTTLTPLTLIGYSSLAYAVATPTLSSSSIALSLSGSQYYEATIGVSTPGAVSLWFNLDPSATGNSTLWAQGNSSVTTNAGAVRISSGTHLSYHCHTYFGQGFKYKIQ